MFEAAMLNNGFKLEGEDHGWVGPVWVKFLDEELMEAAGTECVYACFSDECGEYVVGGTDLEEQFFATDEEAIEFLANLGAIRKPEKNPEYEIVEERKFWLDDEKKFDGYLVNYYGFNQLEPLEFAAFTNSQVEEIAKHQQYLVDTYDDGTPEQYELIKFNADENRWEGWYYDGLYSWCYPVEIEGKVLYFLGSDWGWEW